MRPIARCLLAFALALSNISCSVNILSTFANKDSDEALYYTAVADVNAHDFSGALTAIGKMSTAYAATTPVLRLKASAYGGQCGFIFFDFVQALSGMGSQLLFPFLLANFDAAKATNIDACESAVTALEAIGAITARSDDDNFMIAMLEFAKIGNILSYYADPTKTGSSSTTFDPCSDANAGNPNDRSVANKMDDTDTREIGTGLTIAIANLQQVAGRISAGSSQLTSISNICTSLPAGFNFCAITDPTAFTTNEVKGIRTLVNEDQAIGLGGAGKHCTGDVTACACP